MSVTFSEQLTLASSWVPGLPVFVCVSSFFWLSASKLRGLGPEDVVCVDAVFYIIRNECNAPRALKRHSPTPWRFFLRFAFLTAIQKKYRVLWCGVVMQCLKSFLSAIEKIKLLQYFFCAWVADCGAAWFFHPWFPGTWNHKGAVLSSQRYIPNQTAILRVFIISSLCVPLNLS